MKPSTEGVARACARHPWRAIGAWVGLIVLAIAAVAVLLPGGLTTEGKPTNNPESWQALDAYQAAFPTDPRTSVSDIAVIRSEQHTVDDPQFTTFATALFAQAQMTGAVIAAHTWYTTRDDVTRLEGPSRDDRAPADRRRSRRRRRPRRRGGRPRSAVLRRGDRGRDARPRLHQALRARPEDRGAPVRAPGRAHRPPARVRCGRRRARPAADGDRVDHRRPRVDRRRLAVLRALGLHRQHARRHGPRPRHRLLPVHRLPLPRGARGEA